MEGECSPQVALRKGWPRRPPQAFMAKQVTAGTSGVLAAPAQKRLATQ